MAFFPKRPAIRIVNSVGTVVTGPLKLWLPDSAAQGIVCSARCDYVPEMLGPYMNTAYQDRLTLLGYRPTIDLTFPVVLSDGASGLAVLLSYYTASLQTGTFAALQFNLFHDSSAVWRGVFPTTSWAPKPMGGKDRSGYELEWTLRARDLITAPGDWSTGTW